MATGPLLFYRGITSDSLRKLDGETVQELGIGLAVWLSGLSPPGFPPGDLNAVNAEGLSDFGLRQVSC